METGEPLGKAEFWQRAAAAGFGLWALMVPLGVSIMRSGVADVLAVQREQIETFNKYVLTMERRVTMIEERQARVLQRMEEHERKFDALMMNGNGGRR